uniref:Uncharacterized protein n=1 Tax=Anguilla anguilla TaxID=7936 RepID=A0A0E9ULK6_ANGAN
MMVFSWIPIPRCATRPWLRCAQGSAGQGCQTLSGILQPR